MTHDPLVVVDSEAARFAEVLQGTDLDRAVPSCPGWSARDLLKHLIEVHDFWGAVIGDRLEGDAVGDYEQSREPFTDDADELFRLRAEATGRLVAALSKRDPGEAAWSWFDADQTVDFTRRMQTHEATMHRVDAELAAGVAVSPIDDSVASAGIDHVLDVMLAWVPDDADITPGAIIDLRATDTGETKQLELYRWSGEAWGQTFENQIGGRRPAAPGQAAATVSGPAAQLDLLVWGRPATVERAGDQAALDELQALLDFGLQ